MEDIEGHANYVKKASTPIAVGENLHMTYAFENFILRGAVDFIQPDVARAGGITEIRKITALAAKHRVPCLVSYLGRRRRAGGESCIYPRR